MPDHPMLSLMCITVLIAIAGTVSVAASSDAASSDDEPLKQLFESFLPNSFLEKPVDGASSVRAKKRKSNNAEAEKLMKTAESMMSGLQNIFTGLNAPDIGNCLYKCSNGAKPVGRPGYKPIPNGCGTHEFKADVSDMPGITECCNRHDICYGTCNSGQLMCDRQFNTCMADACETMRAHGVIKTEQRFTECMAIGATFHLTAMALGCEFYRDSQRTACLCTTDSAGADSQAETSQEKIRRYNSEKRARESAAEALGKAAAAAASSEDQLENVDLSNPMFDLPDAVDHMEL